MTRSGLSLLRRSTQTIAVVLIYSLLLSLFVHPVSRYARAASRESLKDDPSAAPSPSPEPSPTPASSPSPTPETTPPPEATPTPEPTPSVEPVTAPSPTQGTPAPNLPNLDILRTVPPEEPETAEATPSTQCSPGQPDCNPSNVATTGRGQAWLSQRVVPTLSHVPSFMEQMRAWSVRHLRQGEVRTNHYRRGKMNAALPVPEPQTGGTYNDFVMARLDADNRIGTGGEDILSRNFNWSLTLVSMAGRSGLNLGLSLSYNSLVWTKSGNYITFDADNGYPTPGFRLGFPVIYGLHYNSQTGTYGYLMLTPSGSRVELRRIGATNIYEAADSSYLQLIDNGNGTLLVRSTDGTQLSYASTSNGYRCTQVKDRNGNYLSITNSSQGRILTVTDTLGRVFNFNYDTNSNLTSISQTRGSSQYTWATFGYTALTLQTNFTGLTIIGTQSGTTLPVLSQISLADGTYYKFSYSSWGQVYKIVYDAADSLTLSSDHVLNRVSYNLPLDATTAQTDCPRFTQRKDWAENWNNGNEAVTNYTAQVSTSWTMPGTSAPDNGTFCQRQTPDGTYYNYYFHATGWDEGMPVLVNTWANNEQSQLVLQRQEATSYTQDNTSVNYLLNPRVAETNIYDLSSNHKRVGISYNSFTLTYSGNTLTYFLPSETREYDSNATSVLRTTQTDYNLNSSYTDRRIFGLVSMKRVYQTTPSPGNLLSQVEFFYDDNTDGMSLVQQGSPVQHDTTTYGTSFTAGRGNQTRVRRWNIFNTSQFVETRTGYNTTGSPIFTRSPLQTSDTQANIIYTDSFSDGQNHNTYAYPTETTIKDTVGTTPSVTISNKRQYSYDLGAVTRTEGPPPAGQTQGAILTNAYDAAGRLYLTTNAISGAYTYLVYPTSSNVIQTYVTIKDANTPTVSAKLFDGAGHVRAIASEHPGSTGGYIGQYFTVDVMGRVTASSNPTEIYGSWQPAGDDVTGWVWSYQSYDWKGRPRVTTNQDGSTRTVAYGGCGCAGGEVVTLTDEVGRKQRTTQDVLGRVVKSEEFQWNGTDVYRTTTTAYNALDQITGSVTQTGSNGTGQTTTTTYDGYGRLATRHTPMQASGTYTSYSYNNDDTVYEMTDARAVVTRYAYNNRQLTTGISYPGTQPTSSNIPETLAATFTYDAASNRTQMTDGLGSVSYTYDRLSNLTSESRIFTALGTNPFTLSYNYNLGNQLTSITDPWNVRINYTRNSTGKLTSVTGLGYPSGTQTQTYAAGYNYRAWGELKSLTYGNTVSLALGYNNRLQVSRYQLTSQSTLSPSPSMDIEYSYLPDGRLRFSTDHKDATLDRAYSYDQTGRLVEAFTGSEARAWVQTGTLGTTIDGPYRQSYTLDTWDHMAVKWGRSFTGAHLRTQSVTRYFDAASGRLNGWNYNADGAATVGDFVTNSFDEAGRLRATDAGGTFEFDGDGNQLKQQTEGGYFYTLRSSVLKQKVAEIESSNGTLRNVFVYGDGQLLATLGGGVGLGEVAWQHTDASGKSMKTTTSGGAALGWQEVDPSNVRVDDGGNHYGSGSGGHNLDPGGGQARAASLADLSMCDTDGLEMPCSMVESIQEHYNEGWSEKEEVTNVGPVPVDTPLSPPPPPPGYPGGTDNTVPGGTIVASALTDTPPSPRTETQTSDPPSTSKKSGKKRQRPAPRQSSTEFPCPPDVAGIFSGGKEVTGVLDSTWELARRTNREEGGWIFMNKQGRLKAVAKTNRRDGDRQTAIDLNSPPSMRGWIVVGTFHTHDYDSYPSESVPGFVTGDVDVNNKSHKVPGIILGGTNSGRMAFAGYEPKRGYWRRDLPERCQKSS